MIQNDHNMERNLHPHPHGDGLIGEGARIKIEKILKKTGKNMVFVLPYYGKLQKNIFYVFSLFLDFNADTLMLKC